MWYRLPAVRRQGWCLRGSIGRCGRCAARRAVVSQVLRTRQILAVAPFQRIAVLVLHGEHDIAAEEVEANGAVDLQAVPPRLFGRVVLDVEFRRIDGCARDDVHDTGHRVRSIDRRGAVFRISAREMIESGTTLRSKAPTCPRTPAGPGRWPLRSTRERWAPRPRSETEAMPGRLARRSCRTCC